MHNTPDILIIGAGQAGLALGYHLKHTPYRFLLVDGNERIGDSWRKRYDSLVLFTPRAYSALPGLAVSGDPEGYPTKDEIADYLETYADHFKLPIWTGVRIRRLGRTEQGFHAITEDDQVIDAQAVVLATGAFQKPAIPAVARQFAADVMQFSTETYRNPSQLPAGSILVVGDGATGRQIARDLMASHTVYLATGRPRRAAPERVLGKSLFWWLDKLGVLRASRESPIGRYMMENDNFPGKDLDLKGLRQQGVVVVGRLAEAAGKTAIFADGSTAEVDAVLWATGYRDNSDWVDIPEAKDSMGAFIQHRGLSPVPNLYFIGRSWQWSRGSALLLGVGEDARYGTELIGQNLAAAVQADSSEQSNVLQPKTA